jgi:ATP synthase protein I
VLREPRVRAGVQYYWKSAGSYATVGLELALSVLAGLFIGRWLDAKFGTGGWLTAIWLGFGVAAGARAVWRALQRANREAEEEERKDREARSKYFDEHHDDPR